MLFNSLSFALFMPVVFGFYWVCPAKIRWLLLLVASLIFYMAWKPEYVILILLTITLSYIAGLFIDKLKKSIAKKKIVLVSYVILSLGLLFFFKYFNFLCESITTLWSLLGYPIKPVFLDIVLPVGISFYTFQTLGYVIDVYKGSVTAERHWGKYASFISFFPQLVAGPIERTNNLLPQIKVEHKFDYSMASYGLKQMAWGFFKKIVIADTLSQYVQNVFDKPNNFQGFSFVLATFFFTIQIYCDFSGYSDIAIGVAKLLGIKLMTNFNSPYFSRNLKEFWSRWHISLSTWLRDYIYIPLGGNKVRKTRSFFNMLLTFLISGLWHGANWTFIIWGGIHGIAQIIEKFTPPPPRTRAYTTHSRGAYSIHLIRILVVFCFCSFAWIFFASKSISDAFYIIHHMVDGIHRPVSYLHDGRVSIGLDTGSLFFLLPSLFLLTVFDYLSLKTDVISALSRMKTEIRWVIYTLFLLWMIFNIPPSNTSEFIYFQF